MHLHVYSYFAGKVLVLYHSKIQSEKPHVSVTYICGRYAFTRDSPLIPFRGQACI